ncbi:STAS domain-containing protein [Nocardioides sp.]|uniref:STAS domain-containing protein n=1 Tax=Nocardioides sp. TaxID=35761 RepID=UPI002EDA75EB
MEISSVQVVGRRSVVRVRGEVDLATAPEVARTLLRLIDDGTELIELDLRDVTFMSCQGIAVVVAASQLAALRGQHVRIVQPSQPTRVVFTLGGVARLLEDA